MAHSAEKLILLIGSNPLPNFIVAMMLRPKKIRGYFSSQTRTVWERLKDCIMKDLELSRGDFEGVELVDPNDLRRMKNELKNLQGWHLNYTGGTKTMSAYFYHLFCQNRDSASTASYLDDHNPAEAYLRFDNGERDPINVDVNMETLAMLHGLEVKTSQQNIPIDMQPSIEDMKTVAKKVLSDPNLEKRNRNEGDEPIALVDRLYKGFNWDKKNPPERDETWNEWVPIPRLISGWKAFPKFQKEVWARFLSGKWLEDYLKELLLPMTGNHFFETGMKYCFPESKEEIFELDLVIIRKHRLYVISCTTDATTHLCKSKAFEILHRVRQLGGDLARAALVCFLKDEKCRAEIKKRIRKNWDSPTEIEVWGLDSLKSWQEDLQNHRVPRELKEWLEKEID